MSTDMMSNSQLSLGDKGIAIKSNPEFDGDNGQSIKFEDLKPEDTASAEEAEKTGRQ